MNVTKRTAALIASGALAASVALAAPAAANNYAPGLPPASPGVPNNPPAAASIVPGIVLVNENVAARASLDQMEKPPTSKMGSAPKPRVRVGAAVKIGATGLTPGATYVVQVKPKGGSYDTLGSVIGTADGSGVMPVFRANRKGTYIMALTNVQTGATQYIKVKATK